MLSYEEFVSYYLEQGRCINDIGQRKNPLNERKLRSRYEDYVRSEEKREARSERYAEKDWDWIEVRQEVFERDGYTCQLMAVLTSEERAMINVDVNPDAVDPAHIYPRSTYPHLKYHPDNVVSVSRIFHQRLDNHQHPLTGDPIAGDDRLMWFQRIIGSRKFYELERKARHGE